VYSVPSVCCASPKSWEPLFGNIKKDPRWLPFLRRIGKAPEQLAPIKFKVTLPGRQAPGVAFSATPGSPPLEHGNALAVLAAAGRQTDPAESPRDPRRPY
jgi:hypothetical protein